MTEYPQKAYKRKQKHLSAIDSSVSAIDRSTQKKETVPSHFNNSSRTKMTTY